MLLKVEAACSLPQFQSRKFYYMDSRKGRAVRLEEGVYWTSDTLKHSRAEINHPSNQERYNFGGTFGNMPVIEIRERQDIYHASHLGNSFTSPTSKLLFALNGKDIFVRFLSIIFSTPLTPCTHQTVADFCLLFNLKLGQSNCRIDRNP